MSIKRQQMVVIKNIPPQHKKGEQEWENPQNPEKPADARDKEQLERQYKEAKRRKDNLSETDHIDKEKKN